VRRDPGRARQADADLRSLYRELSEGPDHGGDKEGLLRELQARRLGLAQQVGLEILAVPGVRVMEESQPSVRRRPAVVPNEAWIEWLRGVLGMEPLRKLVPRGSDIERFHMQERAPGYGADGNRRVPPAPRSR